MTTGIPVLARHRRDHLLAAYQREVGRRRRTSLVALAVVTLLVAVAGHYGEVDLGNLSRHLSGVTSYFGRILPQLRPVHLPDDVAEWYWNFFGWLKLLFDTVLIAYLATLAGTVGAVFLAFLPPPNPPPNQPPPSCGKRLYA